MSEQRLTETELAQRVADAQKHVIVGGRYRHYKGNDYTVVGVALLEATNEPCVLYQPEYGNDAFRTVRFIRPLGDWLATVTVDGNSVPRFAQIDDGA